MQATVVDLRYRMKDVFKALSRNEDVEVLYHGKVKGVLKAEQAVSKAKISDHPFFNMRSSSDSVDDEMDRLRGGRYRDL